jgi:acyl-CoA hydrolase
MNPTESSIGLTEAPKMRFQTRKLVKPEDLNANGTLFGGRLLAWIDEEAAIYAICQLETTHLVTKFMSEINFISSARTGDVVEIGIIATAFGRTSLTLRCEVRNKITRKSIITVDRMVFVSVNEAGVPHPHGKSKMTYGVDQEPAVGATPALPRIYSVEDPVEHRMDGVTQIGMPRPAQPIAEDPPEHPIAGSSSIPVVRTSKPAESGPCTMGDAYLG